MPTISGSTTTYITRETVCEYCAKQDYNNEVAEFARWVLEVGTVIIVTAITRQHPQAIAATLRGLTNAAMFLNEAREAMTTEEDELDNAVRLLAASTNPNAKIKVVTTYSEWISGSRNHSCNYQVSNTYTLV